MTPLASADVMNGYFLEARSKLLDLAAFLDRVDRGSGSSATENDPRLTRIRDALRRLHDAGPNRAADIQNLCSLAYDANWARPAPR